MKLWSPIATLQVHFVAAQQDQAKVRFFERHVQPKYNRSDWHLVFIDESGIKATDFVRHFGRARRGERPEMYRPLKFSKLTSVVGAFDEDGFLCHRIVTGATNASTFTEFLIEDLKDHLHRHRRPTVLVMDNCRIHHCHSVTEALNELVVPVVFLPPYTPAKNPIESGWADCTCGEPEEARGSGDIESRSPRAPRPCGENGVVVESVFSTTITLMDFADPPMNVDTSFVNCSKAKEESCSSKQVRTSHLQELPVAPEVDKQHRHTAYLD